MPTGHCPVSTPHTCQHTGFTTSFFLRAYLQPLIGAWVASSFGFGAMFVVYACTYLGAAAMWLFIDPERPSMLRDRSRA